jgi:hypothetical protein
MLHSPQKNIRKNLLSSLIISKRLIYNYSLQYCNEKILFVIPLTLLMLTVTVTATMPTIEAQDEEEGEGDCQLMDAPNIGEGWQRRVCSNPDYDSYISPSGEECFGNEVSGNTRCGEGPGNPSLNVQ